MDTKEIIKKLDYINAYIENNQNEEAVCVIKDLKKDFLENDDITGKYMDDLIKELK